MTVVSKYANANTVVTTGWTSPTNAYADDTSFATAAPAKNASITSDFGFPAFTTSDIPDGSTINSVTLEFLYKSSTTGSTGAGIGIASYNNGSLVGSESTFGMSLTEVTQTEVYATVPSLADLRTAGQLDARIRGYRTSSNTAITWSLDYVKITVDYTEGATQQTGTDSGAGSDSASLAAQVAAAGASAAYGDAFGRTIARGSGWGTADTGGSWTVSYAPDAGVDGAEAYHYVDGAGSSDNSYLASVAAQDFDLDVSFEFSSLPANDNSTTHYTEVLLRRDAATGLNAYKCRITERAIGSSPSNVQQAQFYWTTGGMSSGTAIGSPVTTGFTPTIATKYRARVQAIGSSPTVLRVKVWLDGDAEPGSWLIDTTDSTAALQGVNGHPGLRSVQASSPNLIYRYDDLVDNLASGGGDSGVGSDVSQLVAMLATLAESGTATDAASVAAVTSIYAFDSGTSSP